MEDSIRTFWLFMYLSRYWVRSGTSGLSCVPGLFLSGYSGYPLQRHKWFLVPGSILQDILWPCADNPLLSHVFSLWTEINVLVTGNAWFYWILGIWCCKHVTNAGLFITPHHTSKLSKREMTQSNKCASSSFFLAISFNFDNF